MLKSKYEYPDLGWYLDTTVNNDIIEFCNSHNGIWEQQYSNNSRASAKGSNIQKAFKSSVSKDKYKEISKLLSLENYRIFIAYILKYGPNSFTKMHVDHPSNSHKTGITLIQQSDDIVGGDAIVIDKTGAPSVIKQNVGQTLWYDQRLSHGVSKIEKGERHVLVTWWTKNDKEQV